MVHQTAPVCLIGYNRPDLAARLMAVVRGVRPEILFVVLDGPRHSIPGDVEACREVERTFTSVDWPCDLRVLRSEVNLGCRRRISSGLDWVFSKVARCIIFEDDCVPHPDCFAYFTKALETYSDRPEVMVVSGTRLDVPGLDPVPLFSRVFDFWGWATWSRSWSTYDDGLTALRDGTIRKVLPPHLESWYWEENFDSAHREVFDSWGYRWLCTVMARRGLALVPPRNLVSNVGFDERSTHCKTFIPGRSNLPSGGLEVPAVEFPWVIEPCRKYERGWQRIVRPPGRWDWIPRSLRRSVRNLVPADDRVATRAGVPVDP